MLQKIAAFLLDYFLVRIANWVKAKYLAWKRRRENKQDAESSLQPLKDATTPEEIDRAADEALKRL